jgi:hypothetical protein
MNKDLIKQTVAELRASEVPTDPHMRAVVALAAIGECTAPHRQGRHEVYIDSRGPYCRACGVADITREILVEVDLSEVAE